ncbi:hypothetical protein [Lysinibacillus sp. SGAir0095]|uniref:hypothetical protein n=1 Tax=Lysinibacillus sp. SGAir0095 TaxID=2070463 RepID=UPI00143DD8AB|nr:hypothetical protein [Lysinibacillus sp. SGAir0095]
MRKRLYLLMSLIGLLSFTVGCTDNGDETPVEAKNEMKETKTSNALNEINSMLKEV